MSSFCLLDFSALFMRTTRNCPAVNASLRFMLAVLFSALLCGNAHAQQTFAPPTSPQKPPGNTPAKPLPNLSGTWFAYGYTDPAPVPKETIQIKQNGSSVVATKTEGDRSIHSGEVTWKGKYTEGSSFPVQVQTTHPPKNTDRVFVDGTATVVGPDEIDVSISAIPSLVFKRNNSASSDDQPPAPDVPFRKVLTHDFKKDTVGLD